MTWDEYMASGSRRTTTPQDTPEARTARVRSEALRTLTQPQLMSITNEAGWQYQRAGGAGGRSSYDLDVSALSARFTDPLPRPTGRMEHQVGRAATLRISQSPQMVQVPGEARRATEWRVSYRPTGLTTFVSLSPGIVKPAYSLADARREAAILFGHVARTGTVVDSSG
jgi:hypothetical protein